LIVPKNPCSLLVDGDFFSPQGLPPEAETLRHERELNLSLYIIDNNDLLSSRKVLLLRRRDFSENKTVFCLWLLVFGLILSTEMNIIPKTKDLSLKTVAVFFSAGSSAGGGDPAA